MQTLLAIVLVLAAEGSRPSPLAPRPSQADLARAEADVLEVFGEDLAKARRPAEKAALARKMIDTAEGSGPAGKYALLERARELAIAAGDAALGIRAVEELINGFGPANAANGAKRLAADGTSANAWASEGHRLWNDAGRKRPPERLRGRLEAAECYLRCVDGLEGFQKGAIEKRLKELGWRVSPIDFNFNESTEGWTAENDVAGLKAEGGCLVGQITGPDPFIVHEGLAVDANRCPVLEIRLAVSPTEYACVYWTTKQSARWSTDRQILAAVKHDGRAHTYCVNMGRHPLWTGQTITGLRIDPGGWDHDRPYSGTFSIDYVSLRASISSPPPRRP